MATRRFARGYGGLESIRDILSDVSDPRYTVEQFRKSMVMLGGELARTLVNFIAVPSGSGILVAAAAEDFDFIARGFFECLRQSQIDIGVACLWTQRATLFPPGSGHTVQVYGEYIEKPSADVDRVLILKSEIVDTVEIKSVIMRLIHEFPKARLSIIAPVSYDGFEKDVAGSIGQGLDCYIMATDSELSEDGELRPGLGGNVTRRLGFDGTGHLQRYMPRYIRESYAARWGANHRPSLDW